MDQFIRFVGSALVPLAVFLVFALARRYVPPKPLAVSDHTSLADLDQQFQGMKWPMGAAMVVAGAAFAVLTHALLVWLNHSYSFLKSADGLRLWPQPAIWWFLPGFGALALCYEITLLIWAMFGDRHKIALYDSWSSVRTGFDSRRVLRWMTLLLVLPIGVFTGLALPMHATLRQADILDCGYAFAGCQTYSYSDARRLTRIDGFRTRDGALTARAGIVIDFSDGRRWSSAEWGDFKRTIDPALSEFLQTKTGLPLQYAEAEADLRPLK